MVSANRRTVLKGIAAGGASLGIASPVSAKPDKCKLNWRKELSQRKPKGPPVVNVTQEVVNDIDHGTNGYWAYLNYRRTIQVWEVDDGHRAIVTYIGQFDGVEGALSYVNGDTLSGEEDGTIHGGYVADIGGTFLEDPTWPTRGFVGTTDYEGVIDDDGDAPYGAENFDPVAWQDQYFDVESFGLPWWGWIYRAGRCGTLTVETGGVRCGDIVCE